MADEPDDYSSIQNPTSPYGNPKSAPYRTVPDVSANDPFSPPYSIRPSLEDFYEYYPQLDELVDQLFDSMDDIRRVGQMMITSAGDFGKKDDHVTKMIRKGFVGGVFLLGGSMASFKKKRTDFAALCQDHNQVPLIFSADSELSLMNKKIKNSKYVKKANQIKTAEECRSAANTICDDLGEIGIQHSYAPTLDLPYNVDVVKNRAFSFLSTEERKKSPSEQETILKERIIEFGNAFIEETENRGIAATAKHFPGLGHTKLKEYLGTPRIGGDPHDHMVYIEGEIKETEIFRRIIEQRVISVMVSHIVVTGNSEYNTGPDEPAIHSRKIVTDLLKNELKFRGLVITDALNMDAVMKIPDHSLKSVIAGCDMILMAPKSEDEEINAIIRKMEVDAAFKRQVYTSVKKILRLKFCLGII